METRPSHLDVHPAATKLVDRIMSILDKGHDQWTKADVDYLLTLYPAQARNAMIALLGRSEHYGVRVMDAWLKRHLVAAIDWNSILNPVHQRSWWAEWRYRRHSIRIAKEIQYRRT